VCGYFKKITLYSGLYGYTYTHTRTHKVKRLSCPSAHHEGTGERGGTAPLILNIGTKLSGQPQVPDALPPDKASLQGIGPRFLGRPVRGLVTITNELYIFLYTAVAFDCIFNSY
jgi:hypothetical protein